MSGAGLNVLKLVSGGSDTPEPVLDHDAGWSSSLSSTRFLVADDSSLMRMALSRSLKALGFEDITTVPNGKEAIAQLLAESFDLIFLDPPYDQTPEELSSWKVTSGLDRLLAPNGRIVWEHSHRAKWSMESPLKEIWRREYGQTCVSFLARA